MGLAGHILLFSVGAVAVMESIRGGRVGAKRVAGTSTGIHMVSTSGEDIRTARTPFASSFPLGLLSCTECLDVKNTHTLDLLLLLCCTYHTAHKSTRVGER